MKKLFCLFCLLFLLTGCAKHSETSDVSFMTWGSESEINIIKSVIADYEKTHEGKKIRLIHTPQNYFPKLHLYFASKMEPDVVFLNNIYSKIYINSGLLEDLTPYFEEEINNGTFYQSSIDSFSADGKLYAIPRDISDMVFYVNKDIFKKNNISIPSKFNSIDEFYALLAELKTDKNFAVNIEPMSIYWLNFLILNGGGIISDDLQHIIITEPMSAEAFQRYSDLASKYHLAPTKAEIASKTTAQMFINGELALYLNGRWMVPKFRSAIKDFDWDVIAFPVSDENKIAVDTSGWAVSKSSKHKEDAVEFVKYMSSYDSIKKITASGLIVPARVDVANSDVFLDGQKPQNAKAFIDVLEYSKPTPVNSNYLFISDTINESTEDIFSGKYQANQVFNDKLKKKLEALL